MKAKSINYRVIKGCCSLFGLIFIFIGLTENVYATEQYDNTGVYQFVERLYNIVLERQPDPQGLDGWYHQLISHNESGAEVARGFLFSEEFTNKGYSNEEFLTILYQSLFDRSPDNGGFEQWLGQLNAGASRMTICKGFVDSQEFQLLCDTYSIIRGTIESSEDGRQIYLTDQFVRRLYITTLGRQADPEGLLAWKNVLLSGTSSGAEIVQGFIFSAECNNKNLNDSEFVDMLYQALFDRSADPEGKSGWLNRLEHGLTRQFVCSGFINSSEFNELCHTYGISKGSAASADIKDRNEALTVWISDLYLYGLDRRCSIQELENALNSFFGGESTGNSFASGILLSEEYRSRNTSNEEFLNFIFSQMLQQDASGEDYENYLNALYEGKKREEIIESILKTNAFLALCNNIGVQCEISVNIPEPESNNIELFKSYSELSMDSWSRLNSAVDSFLSRGYNVGFVLYDLNTGQGIGYNSNTGFYCASTIKGPYVVCLNEKIPSSVNSWGGVMRSTIMISSNEGYTSLRMAFGSREFGEWLKEAGCSNINAVLHYPELTPRDLAQMWIRSYTFLSSTKTNAQWCAQLFTNTLQSPILKTLGGTYTTYSKAGWIGEGGYLNVQNDAGIVLKPGHPYVISIMSSAYGRIDLLNELVGALDAAHTDLIEVK